MILSRQTLGQKLGEICAGFSAFPAVRYADETLSYGALWEKTGALAKGFLAHGVGRGTRVALLETDRPNTLLCFYALARIGAVSVLLNTSWGVNELADALRDTGSALLLYGDRFKDNAFPALAAALPDDLPVREKIYIGSVDPSGALPLDSHTALPETAFGSAGLPGACTLDGLIADGEAVTDGTLAAAEAAVDWLDEATVLFTSGTVGASKGVLNTHASRVNNALVQARDLGAAQSDRFLVALPMFHCFSLVANILAAMVAGACVVFPENRRTGTLLTLIESERCTVLHAVPTLYYAMMAREDFASFDLSSLRIGLIGGAAYPPERLRAIRAVFGYEVLPSLGLTEAGAGITVASPGDPEAVKLETIGHFMDGTQGKILRLDGSGECACGEMGELCVRGIQVMTRYCNADASSVLEPDGTLHTGDLGFLDADGNVHLTGRKKEMVNRGGENICPAEIERAILTLPAVREVKVVGVPDAHYGEELCACIAVRAGESVPADAVRARVRETLADYKVPRYVLYFDQFPLNASGKLSLKALRQAAEIKIQENNE